MAGRRCRRSSGPAGGDPSPTASFGHLAAAARPRRRTRPGPAPVRAVRASSGAVRAETLRAKTLLTALPSRAMQVLVEHADDDAHVGVEMADHQGGRDVDQVVAGQDEDAAGLGDAGLLEHFAAAGNRRGSGGPGEARSSGTAWLSMTTTGSRPLQVFEARASRRGRGRTG